MQAPFSPDTVFRQSNRISSGSTIRKDGSLHRKSGSHRWQSAVADRYSQPARRYSCFGRVVQLDRADGTNSPLFTFTFYYLNGHCERITFIFEKLSFKLAKYFSTVSSVALDLGPIVTSVIKSSIFISGFSFKFKV